METIHLSKVEHCINNKTIKISSKNDKIKSNNSLEDYFYSKILEYDKKKRQKINNLISLNQLAHILHKDKASILKRIKKAGIYGTILLGFGERGRSPQYERMYTKEEAEKIISLYFNN